MHGIEIKEEMPNQQVVFKLSGNSLARVVLSLPLLGLFSCVLLSLKYDFAASTATHCGVANYLPSISSAIGGFTPQRYIWRVCIALHCAPRFMISVMFFNYYLQSERLVRRTQLFRVLVLLNMLLNVAENFCLILLTCVASTENYAVHERSFISFLALSEFHMLFSLILGRWAKSYRQMSSKELQSQRVKLFFFIVNLCACFSAAYFFYRHNSYCEPGVYTYFAMCEYLIVLTNIAFHGSATYEFGHGSLIFVVPVRHED